MEAMALEVRRETLRIDRHLGVSTIRAAVVRLVAEGVTRIASAADL